MAIVRTGKMLDKALTESLHSSYAAAMNTPLIVFTQRRLGPNAKTEHEIMMGHFHRDMNAAAVAAGLPEPGKDADGDTIHYGCDFATGEVLGWEPDAS